MGDMGNFDSENEKTKDTVKLGSSERNFGVLEVKLSNGRDFRHNIVETMMQIGRQSANHLQIRDPEVSKVHCKLEVTTAGLLLSDMDSANGTFVNGQIVRKILLSEGDRLQVGGATLILEEFSESDTEVSRKNTGVLSFLDEDRDLTLPNRDELTVVLNAPEFKEQTTQFIAFTEDKGFSPVDSVEDPQALKRNYERLRVAYDLSRKVGLETDLKRLAHTIVDGILEVIQADTAIMVLRNADGNLTPVVAVGSNSDEEVRIPKIILDRVQETGDALLTSDAMADNQLSRSKTVVGRSIRSALCVPLVVQDEILGMIHLSSSLATGAYCEVDLELLTSVAQPAALAVAHAQLLKQIQKDARMRSSLSRFLSPALVEKVVRQGMELVPEGELVVCTVLFSDIRGFTKLSKGMPPRDVVGLLNEYFEQMVEVVFSYGGTLDKFMGDGLMAVWGTPVQSSTDAFFAAKAADQMRQVLDNVVNKDRLARGEEPLFAGFGIATGHVVAGGIGGARRQDFTVIGDPVNLASRLCNQAVAGQVLVCEETQKACLEDGVNFKALPAITIKGIEYPVKVFDMPTTVSVSGGD